MYRKTMKLNRLKPVLLGSNFGSHSPSHNLVNKAEGGCSNFEKSYQLSHIETSTFQKILLGFGSAFMSISDPRRGDMIAVMGETTGKTSLNYVYTRMMQSEEGRQILANKPRISSATVPFEKLKAMPTGTLGKAYSDFLEKYNYSPDARMAVRFVDNLELAYVVQRYREIHDLLHTLFNMPTNMLGEVTVKWVEAIQTKMPMCIGGALFGAARLSPKLTRTYCTIPKAHLKFEPSVLEDIDNEKMTFKKHPGIMSLPIIELRSDIAAILKSILVDHNVKQLKSEGDKLLRYLLARKSPAEDREIKKQRSMIWEEVRERYDIDESNLSEEESEFLQKQQSQKVEKLLHRRIYHWQPLKFTKQTCLQYLVARSTGEYAVLMKIFHEISKRDPKFTPASLFDFGSGIGTVSWAAHSNWGASLNEYFCVDSSSEMNDLALLINKKNKNRTSPIFKTLYQRQFLPHSASVKFDIVVSAFSLMELESLHMRAETVLNLWNKTNKYLVIVESGTNAGFKLVCEARDFILHVSDKKCHVLAPCPHESVCPRTTEITTKKTPCNFYVRYKEINFGKGKKQEEIQTELYSYVVIKRGPRTDHDPAWARVVRPILRRHKHSICRLCTDAGELNEVIISPGKYGKTVYKCSRYIEWGDLLPGRVDKS